MDNKKEILLKRSIIYLKWTQCYGWMFIASLNNSKDELKIELLEFRYTQEVKCSQKNWSFQPADRYIYKLSSIRPTDPGDLRLFADPILIRIEMHLALLLQYCESNGPSGIVVLSVLKPKFDSVQEKDFLVVRQGEREYLNECELTV